MPRTATAADSKALPRKEQAAGPEVLDRAEVLEAGDPSQQPISLREGSTRGVPGHHEPMTGVPGHGTGRLHEEQLPASMELRKGGRVLDLELRMQEAVGRNPQETGGSLTSRLCLCGIGRGT